MMKRTDLFSTARTSLICLGLAALIVSGCSSSEKKKPQNEEDEDSGKSRISADTPELELLDLAMRYYDRGSFSLSREAWIALTEGYPASYYVPLAELKFADAQYFSRNYAEAISSYEQFIKSRPGHEAVSYAQFQIGNAYFNQHGDNKRDQAPLKQAIKAYKTLLESHPQSPYVAVAKENIDNAIEMLASYEAYVAEFYLKQGAIEPAYGRYSRLMRYYSESDVAKEKGVQIREALIERAPDESTRARYQLAIEKRIDPSMTSPQILVSNLALLSPAEPIIDEDDETIDSSEVAADSSNREEETATAPESIFAKHDSEPVDDKKLAEQGSVSITCQEGTSNAVFVVAVPSRPQIVSEKRDESGQLQIEFSAEGFALEIPDPPARCDAGSASVSISSAAHKGVLQAFVTNPSGAKVTGFAMDRPGRVVLVVSRPAEKS